MDLSVNFAGIKLKNPIVAASGTAGFGREIDKLYGLDKLIRFKTGINAVIAEDAISCVAIGTGKFIEYVSAGRGMEYTRWKPSRR